MPDPTDIPYVKVIQNIVNLDNLKDVPIIGETWNTMNAITDFIEYGCFPHYTIWVDLLWPALEDVFWALLEFSWDDIARGYFRPTNSRGIGRQTRVPVRGSRNRASRTARNIARRGIPEIGEEIGRKLPGAQYFKGRRVTGKEKMFWVIDGLAQRALFYWMVAGLAEDFVVTWTTSIMESEACARPDGMAVRATKTDGTSISTAAWFSITNWETATDTTDGLWNEGIGQLEVPEGMTAYVTLSAETGAVPPGINYGGRVRAFSSAISGEQPVESPWPAGPRDNPSEPATVGTLKGPAIINLGVWADGTHLQRVLGADVMIGIYPD